MNAKRIFTVFSGKVAAGAMVKTYHLVGVDTNIPAILVGEEGRGRKLGILPVSLTPGQQQEWQNEGEVLIQYADLGATKSGKPKLLASGVVDSTDEAIVVFLTMIGFRGGNSHTGDIECGNVLPRRHFFFPGKIIVEGVIAQGAAGNMGIGEQLVATMPKDKVFRTGYSGRLYDHPAEHFYQFNGYKILSATKEERDLVDLF